MDDLEEQCEDALFQVCDARERYPVLCARELEKCIKLTNEIHSVKVVSTTKEFKDIPPLKNDQNAFLNVTQKKQTKSYEHQKIQLENMLDKINNLNMTVEQIEKEKFCEINKLFCT